MTNGKELFVPAVLADVRTIDPGEICGVTLVLPPEYEVDGKTLPIQDGMRPGNAFLAKPLGVRTGKFRRRMYTRSNAALKSGRVLETIINDTHSEKSDTSPWWQSEQVEALHREGGAIDVRVTVNPERTALVVYENSAQCKPTNLRLEPEGEWEGMRFLGIALSTGITPFLAHLRHMEAFGFGRKGTSSGCRFTLIVSVRNPRQLLEHEELLALQRTFPENFTYYPVLTREWPENWPYGRGRIVRAKEGSAPQTAIDLAPLLSVVPDIEDRHVRLCGNRTARNQVLQGLQEGQHPVLSFRSEVW